jgi:hypothetical protein
MKFNAVIKAPPLALNREDAIDYLGSVKLFVDMETAGWIKPVIQKTRFVLFDRQTLEDAWWRVTEGQYPGINDGDSDLERAN